MDRPVVEREAREQSNTKTCLYERDDHAKVLAVRPYPRLEAAAPTGAKCDSEVIAVLAGHYPEGVAEVRELHARGHAVTWRQHNGDRIGEELMDLEFIVDTPRDLSGFVHDGDVDLLQA